MKTFAFDREIKADKDQAGRQGRVKIMRKLRKNSEIKNK